MPQVLSVNQIENSNNTTTRTGDGSFNVELKKAQVELEAKKKSLSFHSQDELQSMFGILPLNFDFGKVDLRNTDDKPKTQETKDTKSANSNAYAPHESKTNTEKTILSVSDVKAIKEALIQFIPNPTNPVMIVPINAANLNATETVSKIDLQGLIDQIVENAKLLKTSKRVELTLLLQEKNLGEMSLSLTCKNGMISIQISANEETKKNLETYIADLENSLKSANIGATEVKVVEVNSGKSV